MAQGGTLFSQVSSQVPLTLPSHASLLTSTYPFVNGLEDNGEQLAPGATTLATVLKSRGYRTAAFVGGFVLDRRFGLDQGFDLYDSPFDLRRQAGKDPGDIKRLGGDVVREATQWLDKDSERPFFLFLHLYDLHTPYDLPPAIRVRYPGKGYDAELGYVDDVLGQFWDYLARKSLLGKVLVVFTSDHGESLGDHGESTHGYFIYQSTLRVPLIVHWPAGRGTFPTRVDVPVSLLDLAPTILQFLGVSQPPQFQGRSLLEFLAAKPSGPAREVYSESVYARNHLGCSGLRSLRVGRYKLIDAPKMELYDLEADPDELRNLYAREQSLALTYRERLRSLKSRYQPGPQAERRALSPEVIARLSSLGYVAVSRAHAGTDERGPDPKDRIAEYEEFGRAITLASSGRIAESNTLLRRLLAQDPGLFDVRNSLGLNQQRLGQHAEAAQNFRNVLKLDSTNAVAHFNLGVSYFELHRWEDAMRELQAALAIAPYYTRAEGLLGRIRVERKDYRGARESFNHLLTVAPADYEANYNLGVLDTIEGRWEEGVRHLRAALEADPQSAEAHNSLGSLYLRQGSLGPAEQEFTAAIQLQPKFAWAHYNLGLVLRQQKRNQEAALAFRRALTADPNFRAAREALDRLDGQRK
jgi:tetratricopeptide (TPR) repeat protein